jgi:HPr kinase/phosphorylase
VLDGRAERMGLSLELVGGRTGLDRTITSPFPQKTGLALAGFHEYLRPGRVLVFGLSEIRYLESLTPDDCRATVRKTLSFDLPCVLVTADCPVPAALVDESNRAAVPVLSTRAPTPIAIAKITALLEEELVDRELVHAVLVDVLGLGVLIIGESGIGKSECALDLVVRGHRLVADDAVELRRQGETILVGSCPELTRHHMEVRGLGVLNIQDLFGIAATRTTKRIELVVQLERWEPEHDHDRLGLDDASYELLGLSIPLIRMPVAPGRNLAILVEVAARNQLLRARGHHAARQLADRLDEHLRREAELTDATPGHDPGDRHGGGRA